MSTKADKGSSKPFEQLEKQNEKLRIELKELSAALEKILSKSHPPKSLQNEPEDKSSMQKIHHLKSEIAKMKRELEGNPNIPKITDLENELKFLNTKLKDLETEKASLQRYEKIHQSALDSAANAHTYPEKIKNLRNDLRTNKEKLKELSHKLKKEEKVLKAQHERCVDLEDRSRKLSELIKSKKKEEIEEDKTKKIEEQEFEVNEFLLKDIEAKIAEAETQKIQQEANLKSRIQNLETQIREKRHHLEMLKIKMKEKEQECKLSLMRVSESKKLVKHNQLRPLGQRAGSSTPMRMALSPVEKGKDDLQEGENKERRRSSTNQKLFHQETMNIIKKINMNINFKPNE